MQCLEREDPCQAQATRLRNGGDAVAPGGFGIEFHDDHGDLRPVLPEGSASDLDTVGWRSRFLQLAQFHRHAGHRWAGAQRLPTPACGAKHDWGMPRLTVKRHAPWYLLVSADQNGGGAVRTWQLQEAKARFSELVREAEGGQAQLVSKHGVPSVVVVDVATYERLTAPGRSLVDALLAAPRFEQGELDIQRDPSPSRPSDIS